MINLFADCHDGIVVKIMDNTIVFDVLKSVEEPVLIDVLDNDKNIKIILEEGVAISLLEKDASNGNIDYVLKNGALLTHNLLLLNEGSTSFRHISLQDNSIWNAACADLSNSKNNLKIQCDLLGLNSKGLFHLSALSKNDSKKVFDINFTHFAKYTESKMENYGVCRDSSSLSFAGTSYIKKDSKKSIANQIAKIMVFDKKCYASASPILKIDENDVVASHGAAEGKINDNHLFYLMSRGIKEEDAKRLITLGYLNPIIPHIFDDETKTIVEKTILERL